MGCTIFSDYPVAQIVAAPEDRAVRLAPGESNREHLLASDVPLQYDILGGGYSNLFLEGGGWHGAGPEPFDP